MIIGLMIIDNRPDDGFDDDSFDATPYDTPYSSDDEDDIKKNMIIYCLNIFN